MRLQAWVWPGPTEEDVRRRSRCNCRRLLCLIRRHYSGNSSLVSITNQIETAKKSKNKKPFSVEICRVRESLSRGRSKQAPYSAQSRTAFPQHIFYVPVQAVWGVERSVLGGLLDTETQRDNFFLHRLLTCDSCACLCYRNVALLNVLRRQNTCAKEQRAHN